MIKLKDKNNNTYDYVNQDNESLITKYISYFLIFALLMIMIILIAPFFI